MGDKFKLPDFKNKIPNFRQQAENGISSIMNSLNAPDFMATAKEKIDSFKTQAENPDMDKIMAFMEKISAANTISKVAKAIGINLEADQVQDVIDKRYELEAAVASRSFGALTNFMEKEGYHVDSPEQMLNDVSKGLSSGNDPIDILKDTAKPFTSMIKDTLTGNHSIDVKNIGSAISTDKQRGIVIQKASELMDSAKSAYYSTQIDSGLLNALKNGDDGYDTSGISDEVYSNTMVAALSNGEVSDKEKDKIEAILHEKYPELTEERLSALRDPKNKDMQYRTVEQIIAADAKRNEKIAEKGQGILGTIRNSELYNEINNQVSPFVDTGKEIFDGVKEEAKKLEFSAPAGEIKEMIPPTLNDVKETFESKIPVLNIKSEIPSNIQSLIDKYLGGK